ncbi:MAG TPA: N-acetylmuramic acid 6-phosphate etherase, partial [Mycobacteriales bacterium]|nr:N-acetylmuramic acid 6-phosphate etherase [Mycobacteriales bacterium]
MPESLDSLTTESRDDQLADLDLMPTADLVALMNDRDAQVAVAVRRASGSVARLVDAVADRLVGGGRLIYTGAGSAGRLGLLDAVECPPTFGLPDGVVVGLLAGGTFAETRATERAEDDERAGADDLLAVGAGPGDAVVAVSASGRTPYAVAALRHARSVGAFTGAVVCNTGSPMAEVADVAVEVVVGTEILSGSTRLKAGTAQKMVLNMISTLAMVRAGRTYGNLMVDVVATNDKLRRRVARIVAQAAGCGDEEAAAVLAAAGGEART